jgi:hypothetical protein
MFRGLELHIRRSLVLTLLDISGEYLCVCNDAPDSLTGLRCDMFDLSEVDGFRLMLLGHSLQDEINLRNRRSELANVTWRRCQSRDDHVARTESQHALELGIEILY